MSSDSDSDSDSIEEFQIKRYLNRDFGQGIRQAKNLQNNYSGIKKQPGFYELRDRKQKSLDEKTYSGNHWDVEGMAPMARATRRLTLHHINAEVDKEKDRKVHFEETEKLMASEALSPMNKEFDDTMKFSGKKMKTETASVKNHQAKVKDDMQLQLLNYTHAGLVAMETEEERFHQIKLLRAMLSNVDKSPSVEDLVDAMSETNQKRTYINRDLEEAFGRLVDDEKCLDDDYRGAMMEMLDESLIRIVLNMDRDVTKKLFEDEQKERVMEQNNLLKDKERAKAIQNFDKVLDNMRRMYQQVLEEEERIEESYKEKVRELKSRVEEELVRKIAAKWVEKACADEKTRRIQECENVDREKNVAWESMKNLMSRVQRQMILSKFDGKWVDFKEEARKEKAKIIELLPETNQDRKMREMRTRSRRPSCVVRGDED
ncbi:caldesmon-like [Mizuhopecten yessoensis]|uniref:Uncharacterized protein n=1 Tax=Mizuhopecten yessoensis TaxID=6573 RepID=A0A210PWU5_MIZYE|nr:caldesmon-like [Mizuhopecten yessoensis]OWF40944.1 hypothetical protein KP79_PYT15971 [Mizuhopecten yessoensis]